MSIFGAIMDKIFHHPAATPADAPAPAPAETAPAEATASTDAPAAAPAAETSAPVDVEAVLTEMASSADDGGGNWRVSIVDLLKLLGLDSSLSARKALADELDCHAAEAGTAEENIALHKAVMAKLAENGGKVPESLKGH
jgi:hypothetical protein